MTSDRLQHFHGRLALPLIAAPMFLVSGVELMVAACRNGVIGSFPSANCRSTEQLDEWLTDIKARLLRHEDQTGRKAAPLCPRLPSGLPALQECVSRLEPACCEIFS